MYQFFTTQGKGFLLGERDSEWFNYFRVGNKRVLKKERNIYIYTH